MKLTDDSKPGLTIKAGVYTSEFLLSVLVIIAATVMLGIGRVDPDHWQWAVGLVAGGYAISRGIAKT